MERPRSNLGEELFSVYKNGPLWAGDTLGGSTIRELVRQGLVMRDQNGDYVITAKGVSLIEVATMKWGVYDRRESFDKTVHVAPCDEHGMIAGGHRVLCCDCQPRIERYGEFHLVVHREES